jgi:hypothetical protein
MKKQIKKWAKRIIATVVLIIVLLLVIVLNPGITYANKTVHNNFTVYHNKPLHPLLLTKLDEAAAILKQNEIYNPNLTIKVCLNDGSMYPGLIKKLMSPAFGRSIYNIVIIYGNADFVNDCFELNNYKWDMKQLLAHEMAHCYQVKKLGIWNSKPLANIPNWKWEGFCEYAARQKPEQRDLIKNIEQLATAKDNSWAITFSDGTIIPKEYYDYWILVQYCLDIKKLSYQELITDKTSDADVRKEMMAWFKEK